MKTTAFILFISCLAFGSFTVDHPLKMSFSKLVISSEGEIELETRIFLDDITEHIQDLYKLEHADFSSTTSNGTKALQQYLENRFYFRQDNEKVLLKINAVSFTKNNIALVLNMTATQKLDLSKGVLMANTLLCDFSPLQANDIKFREERYMLSVANPEVKLKVK